MIRFFSLILVFCTVVSAHAEGVRGDASPEAEAHARAELVSKWMAEKPKIKQIVYVTNTGWHQLKTESIVWLDEAGVLRVGKDINDIYLPQHADSTIMARDINELGLVGDKLVTVSRTGLVSLLFPHKLTSMIEPERFTLNDFTKSMTRAEYMATFFPWGYAAMGALTLVAVEPDGLAISLAAAAATIIHAAVGTVLYAKYWKQQPRGFRFNRGAIDSMKQGPERLLGTDLIRDAEGAIADVNLHFGAGDVLLSSLKSKSLCDSLLSPVRKFSYRLQNGL